MIEPKFIQRIAHEVNLSEAQVTAAIQLLDKGASIPFIARYRKDLTGNLDESRLEQIADRNHYFCELSDRRGYIVETLAKQDRLSEELRRDIDGCYDLVSLEDLYLPFKRERRTKATVAREKGLGPLAEFLWAQVPGQLPVLEFAATFVKAEKAVQSVQEAMEGAAQILIETINTDPHARALVRGRMLNEGVIAAHSTRNAEGKKTKFEAYYNFTESTSKIPSHRMLAILRGVKDGILRTELQIDDDKIIAELVTYYLKAPETEFEPIIRQVIEDAYQRHLRPAIEVDVLDVVRERADREAIRVFRENAQNLLMAPPAGPIPVIGIVTSARTGCKLAVIDATGVYLESATIITHPPQPDADTSDAENILLALMHKHHVCTAAIGNGGGAREVAAFVKTALSHVQGREMISVLVTEAAAAAYSVSKIGREEFPNLDTGVREAISIARRLQDPLAELVKVEPRSIGVGQYQHDVNQKMLRDGLQRTIASCVNKVGVDPNSASEYLLRYVSGLQPDTAKNIVEFRAKSGRFSSRQRLNEVTGVNRRVFEQCAGFLRISGDNPLDATAIHPEVYPIVEQAVAMQGLSVADVIANRETLDKLDFPACAGETLGKLALADLRHELLAPTRDPRPPFKVPKFLEGLNSVADLQENMELEGIVTNVTDFGAFVDIGIHQDGLVHLSELANRFVRVAHEVVRVGDVVKVKVIKVDKEQPRISLSIRALLPVPEKKPRAESRHRKTAAKPADFVKATQDGAANDGHRRTEKSRRPQRSNRPERAARNVRNDGRAANSARKPGKSRKPPAPRHEEKSGGLNTLLADQLAALREKFGA